MISNGSELLLLVPKLAGMIGSVVLPFLGSVPDCAISMHRPQLESFYVHSCILWSWRHRVCSNSDFYWYRCTCRLYRHAVDHSMGPQVHFWLLMNHVHIVLSVVVWISMKMEKETMRSLRELPLYFFFLFLRLVYQIDLVKIIQSSSLVYDKNWCWSQQGNCFQCNFLSYYNH